MLFSSVTFLYWFLPLVLLLYFLTPRPKGSLLLRNLLLFVASIVFYAWGEPIYVLIMLGQAIVGWASGLLIGRMQQQGGRASVAKADEADAADASPNGGKPAPEKSGRGRVRAVLVVTVLIELSGLLFFKYTDFFLQNLNTLFNSQLRLLAIALPLGISFYTFQILSYTVDLYRGKVKVQRNPLYFATYVTLFPQLIAGPIVRYADIEEQLAQRTHSIDKFTRGIRRFTVGLGKKVLIANTLGQLVGHAQDAIQGSEQSVLFAILFLVAFTLQIYFDFSGYSDMAIGLGLMFGFTFLENFNYPLTARSITDFWRRWHMSMSYWFRDYVYISLGGNRVRPFRHILNILIVWMATGFWHGAGWNFILWGLYMAVFLLAEKYLFARLLKAAPAAVGHVYLLIIIALSWILFESESLGAALATFAALIGQGDGGIAGIASLYYLRDFAVPIVIAAIGSTRLPMLLAAKLRASKARPARVAMTICEPAFVIVTLVLVTAFLVDGSFNPFIYFRF
jgi:alginate O-acetyltransferase complex protein AlgI